MDDHPVRIDDVLDHIRAETSLVKSDGVIDSRHDQAGLNRSNNLLSVRHAQQCAAVLDGEY